MKNKIFTSPRLFLFGFLILLVSANISYGAATIVINNVNAAGVGFNDGNPAAPVGGNTGTTLGQQRLIAFQEAANIWGATLTSSITITINAEFTPLTCTSTGAVLGSAGSNQITRDFAGAPFAGTWYSNALADKLSNSNLIASPGEINANFNVNLGQAGCLDGVFFYLGLDNNHGNNVDLVTTLLHEFGHGLGFQTFTSGTTGAFNAGFPSIADRFLIDGTTGKSWLSATDAERAASAIAINKLAWDGPVVLADVPGALTGIPFFKVNSPAANVASFTVGTAAFGPLPNSPPVTADLLLANDGTAPTTDGCEAFPAGFFAGKIAVVDRGVCSFKTKTRNAQNAGALGVVLVNNAAGAAPGMADDATITTAITIPTVSLSLTDGTTVKNGMSTATLNGSVGADTTTRLGADAFGRPLMFTPNPFQSGSSVSHWDTTATPNQIMEPAINGDLPHIVIAPRDLTFSQMKDIGWIASVLPSTLTKTAGDNQTAVGNTVFPTALQVTGAPAAAGLQVTWTIRPAIAGASNANFAGGLKVAVSTTDAAGVANAPPLTANLTAGTYTVNATIPGAGTVTFNLINLPPTAADVSISGRVMTFEGRGLTNARVTVTDANGVSRTAITGKTGRFVFDGLEAGATYVVTVASRRFTFSPRVITLTDDLADVNFIAE